MEEQQAVLLDEAIRLATQELFATPGPWPDEQIGKMFERLTGVALNGWFPDAEPTTEARQAFADAAFRRFRRLRSQQSLWLRMTGDISQSIVLAGTEVFGIDWQGPNRAVSVAALKEAAPLLELIENAGPEDEDKTYVARVFERLAKVYLSGPDADLMAIARTAEERLKDFVPGWRQAELAAKLVYCLERALAEESRKVDLPSFDYDAIPARAEEELDDYETDDFPLALRNFTQRIFKRALLKIRVDEHEIFSALRELDENIFPKWTTREEYIKSMEAGGWPEEIRTRALASLDEELAAQPEQTAEIVADLLERRRTGMREGRVQTMFASFMEYSDHGMRCAIATCLFLAKLYADADFLLVSGAQEKEIDRERPSLTELKKQVAAYFADELIRSLPTRARPGKEQDYELADLPAQFEAVKLKVDKAKKSYTRNKDTDNWFSHVKTDVSDMPDDLIKRLGAKKNARENQPRSIALEWAARIAGERERYPNNHYSADYLDKRLRAQNRAL